MEKKCGSGVGQFDTTRGIHSIACRGYHAGPVCRFSLRNEWVRVYMN